MKPKDQDDYNYYIKDFESMLTCPQCEAQDRLDSGELSLGYKLACLDVLSKSHECNQQKEGIGK